MYTASYIAPEVARMKSAGTSKADIIRQVAELCLGWPYVWASNGQMCTPEWRRNRIPYCPEQKYSDMIRDNCPVLIGSASSCTGCKWDGVRCFDCQGFVHWLFEQVGVPLYGSGATTQWNTPSNWAARGTIDSMPPGLVCAVYKRKESKMSHAGMSMGDGSGGVIHCSTIVKRGNVNTDRPAWTHWGIPKGLYTTEELRKEGISVADNTPTLRRGNKGEAVEELQALLNAKFGFDLEIDGDFGKATETAVKEFQKKHGLTADGVVGKKTWAALGVSPEIVNPPVDNGNNDIKPSEPPVVAPEGTLTDEAKTAIRAAYASAMTACSILKKLLEGD